MHEAMCFGNKGSNIMDRIPNNGSQINIYFFMLS
jgi:hypothetical protein